ncbi:imm11 family protein [Rummeliibacillus pycnus]|uniref:imm11 family protein n=1 Tax=Rummeliibacillus pycnus TaxID=101070 RepID=UPI0037CC347B
MKYFKLIIDDSNDNDVVVHCEDTLGFEQYELKEGNYLENWSDNITFYYNLRDGNRFTDYLANNWGWFIVSEKLKRLINTIGEGVQFLPVNVVDFESKTRIEDDEYFVANVLEVVDALNLENSDYSVMDIDGEKIYSVRKYAVSEEKINNKNIFKLKGDEIPFFVSETFKQLVEGSNITGCDFLEIRSIL